MDLAKINREIAAGRLLAGVGLVFTTYIACQKRKLQNAAIRCSDPMLSTAQVLAMANDALKNPLTLNQQKTLIERYNIEARRDTLNAPAGTTAPERAALMTSSRIVNTAANTGNKTNAPAMAAQIKAHEKAILGQIGGLVTEAKGRLAAAKTTLQKLKAKGPPPRQAPTMRGLGAELFPGFLDAGATGTPPPALGPVDPMSGLPAVFNQQLVAPANMPFPPPIDTPLPAYCTGAKIKKADKPLCLIAQLTKDTQKQNQWLFQELFRINQEMLATFREIMAYIQGGALNSGGGAAAQCFSPYGCYPDGTPMENPNANVAQCFSPYGCYPDGTPMENPNPQFFDPNQFDQGFVGPGYGGSGGGFNPGSGGTYTEVMESGPPTADSTGVVSSSGGGWDGGEENPMMQDEAPMDFNISPAPQAMPQNFQQNYGTTPLPPQGQVYPDFGPTPDYDAPVDLEDAPMPTGDADFGDEFAHWRQSDDTMPGTEEDSFMSGMECCEACSGN